MNIKNQIETANEIIEYAIKNNTSVKAASKLSGFADTYVKNVKSKVIDGYNEGKIDITTYKSFFDKYNTYQDKRIENKLFPSDVVNVKLKTFKMEDFMENKIFSPHIPLISTPPPTTSTSNEQIKFDVNGNIGNVEWKGNNYSSDHIKTLEQLLEAAEVDTDVWTVKDYLVNKWDVTLMQDKQPRTIQNFQVKARLEKLVEEFRFKQAGEIFIDMIKNYTPPVFNIKQRVIYSGEKNLLEVNIADLHFGKLTHKDETGENYDIKIASKRFLNAIETLLHRASGFSYEKILFVIGNDFFNSDTLLNTTTAGTPQDEDLRWYKTFSRGISLVVDGIELLKAAGVPVDVMIIAGNHDYERSYYMGEYLVAWYRNDDYVNINNGASPRKYYKYGQCLLGFTHGSEEKEGSLPMVMANDVESKALWSETKYHEFHVGHWHHRKTTNYKATNLIEDQGVTIRILGSLSGSDSWHNKKGFVGGIKCGEAFVWGSECGLIAHLTANLKEE